MQPAAQLAMMETAAHRQLQRHLRLAPADVGDLQQAQRLPALSVQLESEAGCCMRLPARSVHWLPLT